MELIYAKINSQNIDLKQLLGFSETCLLIKKIVNFVDRSAKKKIVNFVNVSQNKDGNFCQTFVEKKKKKIQILSISQKKCQSLIKIGNFIIQSLQKIANFVNWSGQKKIT